MGAARPKRRAVERYRPRGKTGQIGAGPEAGRQAVARHTIGAAPGPHQGDMRAEPAARQIKPRLPAQAGDPVMQGLQRVAACHGGKDQATLGLGHAVDAGKADLDRLCPQAGQQIMQIFQRRLRGVLKKSQRQMEILVGHGATKGNGRLHPDQGTGHVIWNVEGKESAHRPG